jgi:predicted nucleic acid-binding protein
VILVDSSVWIDHLRNTVNEPVSHLRSLISREELLVGDLILCELLQGLRSDSEAKLVEDALREFAIVSLIDAELAVKAAANYRFLRSQGFTVRRTIDLIIGTFCYRLVGHHLRSDGSPVCAAGSIVIRNFASAGSEVIWQITTDAWLAGKASD